MSPRKKRPTWLLPKEFTVAPDKEGTIQRFDGEPVLHALENHGNDRTLSAHTWLSCCSCGLTHLHTYNVMKAPDGQWWLLTRAFRAPGTGESK